MADVVCRADLLQELVRLAVESGDRTFQVIETQQGIVGLQNRASRHRVTAQFATVPADRKAYRQLQASGWIVCHWNPQPSRRLSEVEVTEKAILRYG